MKAADIDDAEFLTFVEETGRDHPARWVQVWDFEQLRPQWPWKVARAKARRLIRRGLLNGCTCGCRGDFVLTEAGRDWLATTEATR